MRSIIAEAGSLNPKKLSSAHAAEIDHKLKISHYALSTKKNYANSIRKLLKWLWEAHGAEKTDSEIQHYTGVRPRNVTVRNEEAERLLEAAPPFLRLWLLLCADLGIRSGTSAIIAPENYDPRRNELRFTTKMGAKLTLPVTDEIQALIMPCDHTSSTPYVRQLWVKETKGQRGRPVGTKAKKTTHLNRLMTELRMSLGLTRRFTPHDLRRTVAVAMLETTNDVRDVQALLGHRNLGSTLWYLDHDLRQVKRQNLELIKGNRTSQTKGEKTA
jgi:integrase